MDKGVSRVNTNCLQIIIEYQTNDHFKLTANESKTISSSGNAAGDTAAVPMSPSNHPGSLFFFLLCFIPLPFLAQSSVDLLLHSDHDALLQILKELGSGQTPARNPCGYAAGIFCERRLINNSIVLRITRIVFESQHLKGKLSPAIGQLTELKEISLADNKLVDQIPAQIIGCKKLEVLNLRNNRFSGEIPTGFSSLIRLRILDLSSNKFIGDLKFLGFFSNLEKLNLADNSFAGKLPNLLRSCRNLRFINVSGNSLLEVEGMLPMTNDPKDLYFTSESVVQDSFTRRYLYSESLQSKNVSTIAIAPFPSQVEALSPIAPPKHKQKKKNKAAQWTLRFFAGLSVGSASGLVLCLLFKVLACLIKERRKDTILTIFSPVIKKPEELAFLDKEDALTSLQVIGRGGCGEVYKAALPGSNGMEIAIKKIIQLPSGAEEIASEDSKLLNKKMRQIRSEIQTVGQIRHRNLLPLLAHMPRPECHYLVYEYMKNGSLQDYLQHVAAGKKELPWLARYKIAQGVATGLEYLHNNRPRIIHRDLKPANVLLDDELEARIADFGLAKAVPDANTHVTSSNIAGTVGYIAPEYYQTFKFTDKCDIYSFGVLLGVLVIGKLPSDEFFQCTDELSLVKWMRNLMTSEDPRRVIDSKLLGNGYEQQMLLVLKIACFCTLDDPKARPNSIDARCMLSQIKH